VALEIDVRPSEAPLIDCVWRGRSTGVGILNSVASSHWHLVVSEVGGAGGGVAVSVHGPETRPVAASLPLEGSWVGVRFRLGVMLHGVPIANLVDGGMVLPEASHRTFWWKGGTWERPTYDNAEGLVTRLAREGLIGPDPLIHDALQGGAVAVSLRTLQRRFSLATGQTRRAVRQIEQARRAAIRLREGTSPADVTYELGYYDQPHLTRSTRRYLGRTPAELASPGRAEQLSLLYKTDAAGAPTLTIDRLRDPVEAA
jgi:AraC-like DNA-binding protein